MRIKTFDEIVRDMLAKVATRTRLSNFNPGSIIRTLVEIIAFAIAELYGLVAAVIKQGFLSTATGFWLELKVKEYNLTRKPAITARGRVAFGRRRNLSANVTIPAGVIVSTLTDQNGRQYRFVTTEEIILQSGAAEVQVPIVAEGPGAAYNVGAGAIQKLSVYVSGIDYVRNNGGWITAEGADTETDEELRRRGFLAWAELARGGTRDAYVAWALAVPGVKNVFVDDTLPRGQGTVDVYIISASGLPTPALVAEVQAVVNANKPITADAQVKAPTVRWIAIDFVITPRRLADTTVIEAELRTRFDAFFNPSGNPEYDWIDPLGIGRDVVLNQLRYIAMSVPGVYDVSFNAPAADIVIAAYEFPVLQSLGVVFAPATQEV